MPPGMDYVEVIEKRLCWRSALAGTNTFDMDDVHCFSIDDILVYEPLCFDFGPVDLGMTHWFVSTLHKKMKDPAMSSKTIILCCDASDAKRANAAYLICAYMVVLRGCSAEEAFKPFDQTRVNFSPFRDASRTPNSSFPLTVLDCLRGLEGGMKRGWYNRKTFDLIEYTRQQIPENGDMSWIISGKILALSGPRDRATSQEELPQASPLELVPIFKKQGVSTVVRLNSPEYSADDFTMNDIEHFDLWFKDESCPSMLIARRFQEIVANASGGVAVHCKAGLGRTGTIIGLYAMQQYGMTAKEYIAWARLCRPGCVIGAQQQFLCDAQAMFCGGPIPSISDSVVEQEWKHAG